MTYQSGSERKSKRILIFLVLVTIVMVAYWGVNGGIDQIVISETSTTLGQ